jgi:chromosome segregation ATPase
METLDQEIRSLREELKDTEQRAQQAHTEWAKNLSKANQLEEQIKRLVLLKEE